MHFDIFMRQRVIDRVPITLIADALYHNQMKTSLQPDEEPPTLDYVYVKTNQLNNKHNTHYIR